MSNFIFKIRNKSLVLSISILFIFFLSSFASLAHAQELRSYKLFDAMPMKWYTGEPDAPYNSKTITIDIKPGDQVYLTSLSDDVSRPPVSANSIIGGPPDKLKLLQQYTVYLWGSYRDTLSKVDAGYVYKPEDCSWDCYPKHIWNTTAGSIPFTNGHSGPPLAEPIQYTFTFQILNPSQGSIVGYIGHSDIYLVIESGPIPETVVEEAKEIEKKEPEKEKSVVIKGFTGISQDLPLSKTKITLLYNNKEIKKFADSDGKYMFEISLREGESVNAQLIATLTDERWIEVYDELGPGGNNFIVEYETEKFTIDGSQDEIIKDVLITEELKSNVHEKKFNKDVAAVYHWAWKAAQFAEDNLKLQPRPVGIITFKPLQVVAGHYQEVPIPTFEFGQIGLSARAVELTGQVKPGGVLYPSTLWHEFGHHIEASSPFFGKRGDFDNQGYINHGGYRNSDSKDSVMEGFAIFFSSVMADYYRFAEPHLINPPATWNLENNWPVWFNLGGIRGQEDYAVASILWDIYDPVNPLDSDNLDLSLDEMWDIFTTRLTKPATLYDIFKGFSAHPKLTNNALADRFVASDVYVDAEPYNNKFDDTERSSIGKSRWGYDDINKNGLLDSDELAGAEPEYPRVWEFEREDPPPIENSVVRLEIKNKLTKKPIDNFDIEVLVTHPAPYEFYNWEYTLNFKNSLVEVPVSVLVRKDALAKITVRADGYKEGLVYEINGKDYLKKMHTPGLEYLDKLSIELAPEGFAEPSTASPSTIPIIIVVLLIVIVAALVLSWKLGIMKKFWRT